MNASADNTILHDHFKTIYRDFRNADILKYSDIKLGLGFIVITYFALLDIVIQHNVAALFFRLIPLTSIIVFFILRFTLFRKSVHHVNLFYNAFLVSISIMMYGKAFINVDTPYFTSSLIGTIMVLSIVGLETKARLRTSIFIFTIPAALFIIALVIFNKMSHIPIVDLSHIFGIIIIGITINHIQETLRFKAFVDQKKLEIEKNKTEMLYQSVLEQKEEIEAQKEEIESQRDSAEIQRDKIISQKNEITASIEYAKRIQQALLPQDQLFSQYFKDHFILYKPKDIVSGDFYWINKIDDWVLFAMADCTGHGVPGAFMSMLGITILNELTGKQGINDVDVILNELRATIISSLRQQDIFGETKDGMDMAICAYNAKTNMLHFSGANNSLILIREEEGERQIVEIKGDKMPISIYRRLDAFTSHSVRVKENDKIYMFSDGYADQFGGDRQKKFKMKPFKEMLRNNSTQPMRKQHDILNNHLLQWMQSGSVEQPSEQNDDITVIGISF